MEEPRRVLVLGAGPAQVSLLEAARLAGDRVIAVDRDPSAPGFPLAHRRAIVPIDDEQAIERLARAEGVEAIAACGDERAVALARRVAERLGLPFAA